MSSIPPHEAGAPRRRTVLATPTRRPFALIAQHPQTLRAVMLDYGPCVPFPSITHFRNASEERWAGVLIARASAWDPVLEVAAKRNTPIALIDVVLEHEWPADVERLENENELRSWLERCVAPKIHKLPERPAAARRSGVAPTPAAVDDLLAETPASPLAVRDMRSYGRPRSQLLIVARAPAVRARLFRALRAARPVRVVSDLAEVAESERSPATWLGVVVAGGNASEELLDVVARHPSVILRLDPAHEPDELALKHWLLRAVAFEYAGNSVVAEVIADAFMRADPASYVASIEVCALYASSLRPDQRALALDMTDHTWRWYAKESAKALTISSKALARKALDKIDREDLLAPSEWLTTEPTEAPPRLPSLYARLPEDIRRAPLSRVPWPDGKFLAITRIALEQGVHTIEALLALDLASLDTSWAHERTCDSLQEAMLATLPFTGDVLPHEATTFPRLLDSLKSAMPSDGEALSLTQPSGTGRKSRGLPRALRFYEPLLESVRTRLMRSLDEPASLAELAGRDPFFDGVSSLEELRDAAQSILRLALYFSEPSAETARFWTKPSKPSRSEIPRTQATSRPAPAPRPVSPEEGLALAESALRDAGTPLDRGVLSVRLGDAAQTTLYRMAGTRPFVELDARTWGLIERDLPGGDACFDAAVNFLRNSRGSDLNTSDPVITEVRALSADHARWTREMAVAAIRYARNLRT